MTNATEVRRDDHAERPLSPADAAHRIRQLCAQAESEGRERPGRPTLKRLTGATDHQIRQVLAEIDASTASDELQANSKLRQGLELDETGHPINGSAKSPAWTGGAPRKELAPATTTPVNAGEPMPGGRLVAWLGFAFGSIMSVAANVLHTWLPADEMPPGWAPGVAPQIGAAVWPIGLLISVEVLSRVRWRTGFMWSLARYGGAGTVAVGSGVISYGHLREVLLAWGYGHPGADVGPFVLDGLMVVSGFALLAMGGEHGASDRQNTTRAAD